MTLGITCVLRLDDIVDLSLHQLVQHAEPDADARRQQSFLPGPGQLTERFLHPAGQTLRLVDGLLGRYGLLYGRRQDRARVQAHGRPACTGSLAPGSNKNRMVPEEQLPRFYRGCVLTRVVRDSATKISSIPGVVITPIVASVFATVVAVSQPAPRVHNGVVDSPSLLEALQYSVGGALAGIVFVVAVVSLVTWARYRISGDPIWTAVEEWIEIKGSEITIYLPLQGSDLDAVDPSWLVAPECVVRFPTGAIWSFKLVTTNPTGVVARIDYIPEPGQYAYRWYDVIPGTQRRYEVARRSFYFEPPGHFKALLAASS
jgi:hypothetical protein